MITGGLSERLHDKNITFTNVFQNLDMKIGANIFYGDNGDPGSEFGGFIIPGTGIHSTGW